MSLEGPDAAPFVPSARYSGLFYLPVLHHTVESAEEVSRAVSQVAPDEVALELCPGLAEAFLEGVARLPSMSVLLFEDERGGSFAHIVHPAEPFVEAVRVCLERGIPWRAIDADVARPDPIVEPYPDPYTLRVLGTRRYYEEWTRAGVRVDDHPLDRAREIVMATNLASRLEQGRTVLAVMGLAHVAGVEAALAARPPLPMTPGRVKRPVLFNLHPDSLGEVLPAGPLVDALFELRRSMPPPEPAIKEDPAAARARARASTRGLEVIEGQVEEPEALTRRLFLELAPDARVDTPRYAGLDRQQVLLGVLQAARRLYRRRTDLEVPAWQWRGLDRTLFKFARAEGRLLPDPYQVLAAARGAVDDNYAWEVHALLQTYPWQTEWADLPSTTISADQLKLGSRAIRIRRRLPRSIRRLKRFPVRQRPTTADPEAWLEEFEDAHIVSYPPEDLEVESFAGELKERGRGVFHADQARSEPFTTSLLDGVDVRETLRHFDQGRVYVREDLSGSGDADTVVVIFEREDTDRYPFRMTWLGEHQNESDMAFYSTDPLSNVAGPGVARCEHGGFMLIFPPMQLYDVWRIPEYQRITARPDEILTLAALDYSRRRNVMHVGPKPPAPFLQSIARSLGRRLVHLPLGRFDPERIKRLRTCHILNGKKRREDVRKYLW